MPRLSVIIITKNESANIGACLDSVAFADECIVIDDHSDDDTRHVAAQKGARVMARSFDGFGPQKNFALSLAQGDWILSIDADERVTPSLRMGIESVIANPSVDGYEIRRLSSFCGRRMLHSGWNPDFVLRLFRRGRGRFTNDVVHERVVCDGVVGRLDQPLTHAPVARLEDALSRMDRYSTAGAVKLMAKGRRVTFFSGIWHGLGTFLRTYFLRAGFLDGPEGFLLAVANAEGAYYRYMKAWLATRHK